MSGYSLEEGENLGNWAGVARDASAVYEKAFHTVVKQGNALDLLSGRFLVPSLPMCFEEIWSF